MAGPWTLQPAPMAKGPNHPLRVMWLAGLMFGVFLVTLAATLMR
jgi:hypothetical protein